MTGMICGNLLLCGSLVLLLIIFLRKIKGKNFKINNPKSIFHDLSVAKTDPCNIILNSLILKNNFNIINTYVLVLFDLQNFLHVWNPIEPLVKNKEPTRIQTVLTVILPMVRPE